MLVANYWQGTIIAWYMNNKDTESMFSHQTMFFDWTKITSANYQLTTTSFTALNNFALITNCTNNIIFLTEKEFKFSSMFTPSADTHQVYYRRMSLLPHFAMAIAAHDIRNLEQLSLKTLNPPTKSVNWVPSCSTPKFVSASGPSTIISPTTTTLHPNLRPYAKIFIQG